VIPCLTVDHTRNLQSFAFLELSNGERYFAIVSTVEWSDVCSVFGEFGLCVQHECSSITGVERMTERESVDDLFARCILGLVFHSFAGSECHVRYPSVITRTVGGTLQTSDFYLIIQVFLGMSAAIGVVAGFMRWADKKLESRIVKEIQAATYQIQPTSNGGASLKDLHNKIDGLIRDVGVLKTAVLRLETEVRTLEEDVEDLR